MTSSGLSISPPLARDGRPNPPSRASSRLSNLSKLSILFSPSLPSGSHSDHLAVPIASYVEVKELLKFTRHVNSPVDFTAISAMGDKVVMIRGKKFVVFNTNPIAAACFGSFTNNGKTFRYAATEEKLDSQVPLPQEKFQIDRFYSVALSSEFLALGSKGRLMVFTLLGDYAGRWICDEILEPTAVVERLTFSSNGEKLLAILKVDAQRHDESYESKAVIFSTKSFPRDELKGRTAIKPTPDLDIISWNWDYDSPTGAAFSQDGTMVAICTDPTQSKSKIRLLKQIESKWKSFGLQWISVFSIYPSTWLGNGPTGIALYVAFNHALTLASTMTNASFYPSIPLLKILQTAIASMRQTILQPSP